MIIKACGFSAGFGFFGDPVFKKTLDFLNRRIPDWKKYLDVQRYICSLSIVIFVCLL